MSYFDAPRRVKARELAELLWVSSAVLKEFLREALRNLIVERYIALTRGRSEG
ncbi:MAG: helix-turn-helix domain-containing protein [Candidatus Korarchaeum sp.]|nr:helix-turn-helix domain-containing protein [Candidatus Korarchaeum sp.]MDW8035051.1 helix-turn-helix domain-containing protein [Candidatus Korarchaeum sp.]